jgi:hypothetical protein
MPVLLAAFGLLLMTAILWDAFETIILPRRVTRFFRLARIFYRGTWRPWRAVALQLSSAKRRDAFLSYYGPLSLLVLFGLWAFGLIFSFATLYWATAWIFGDPQHPASFRADLYMSGTTFFTLGLGDVVPHTPPARLITVMESGMGFGFLAIVISYLPVLYGAFSEREVNISLLDARAGSPPSAVELLRRHLQEHRMNALVDYLRDWETWSAQLMESHLSYPVLCYFRSQHQNQSWLAALTTMLDVCAVIMAAGEPDLSWQARLTFAISRHAVVDLAQVMSVAPKPPVTDRLSASEFAQLEPLLAGTVFERHDLGQIREKLQHLRSMYEPYVNGFSDRLLMQLPGWVSSQVAVDNWRTSAWKPGPAVETGSSSNVADDHF